MPSTTDRHPSDRPGGETRTAVQIDAEVYDAIRRFAIEDERTIARYVNRVLRQHVEERQANR